MLLQAVRDSGLPTNDGLSQEEAERVGCLIGSGIAYSLWKTRGQEEPNWPAEAQP